jgi:uncharacterized protein (TIGR00290 family)
VQQTLNSHCKIPVTKKNEIAHPALKQGIKPIMPHKSYFNWSGGKDSALALYHALQDKDYSIDRLLTNVNGHHRRISMHGVREDLLDAQARSMGLPLQKILLPEEPTMAEYEQHMMETMKQFQVEGFTHAFFGDIFLEDLKTYRQQQLARLGFQACFPLWKKDTRSLLSEFIDLGFRAIVVCIDSRFLDQSFAGRMLDLDFLKDLPPGIDPCGENGEYHSFVFDGPIFKEAIRFQKGENLFREYKAPGNQNDQNQPPSSIGFWFTELYTSESDIFNRKLV